MKKRLRLKKRVKYILAVICFLTATIFLTHLFCSKLEVMNSATMKCDQELGRKCSNYEINLYLKRGE